jgi:hypothetical protein
MLESTIEKAVVTWAKSNGWLSYKMTSQFARGWPDRLFIKTGRVVFIEFKAPGKKPTVKQQLVIDRLIAEQSEVYVIDNREDGINVLTSK